MGNKCSKHVPLSFQSTLTADELENLKQESYSMLKSDDNLITADVIEVSYAFNILEFSRM